MRYEDYIYDIVKALSHSSKVFTEDYLIEKIGIYGVDALLKSGSLELRESSLGVPNYIFKNKKGR